MLSFLSQKARLSGCVGPILWQRTGIEIVEKGSNIHIRMHKDKN